MQRSLALLLLCLARPAWGVSPVQKVIELLEECKAKIVKDLAAEEKAMEEYSTFCDSETTEKGYAIKSASRDIADLNAEVENTQATIGQLDADIAAIGAEMAAKDKELHNITSVRSAEHTTFQKTEKELMETMDETARAAAEIKRSMSNMSFVQIRGTQKARAPTANVQRAVKVLAKIVDAAWVQNGDKRALKALLQQAPGDGDDLTLRTPEVEESAAPATSNILATVEEMKEKAEDALTDARNSETKSAHAFAMMEQGLQNEIKVAQDKKADASASKETAAESLGKATSELTETTKTRASDEAYLASLQVDCQQTADAWEARQKDAKEEMAAVDKAKEILANGVKVFVQVSSSSRASVSDVGDDDASSKRSALVTKLKQMAKQYHSFALVEMATAASSDPFLKIRGLVEDMLAKLAAEAAEEATQKGFCDEAIGKSKKSQAEKTMDLDTLKARLDKAVAGKAKLEGDIKDLEGEVAGIDAAQAEAAKIRNQENADYQQSSKDFKDSAEATEQAIIVLKEYYGGSLLQVSSRSRAAAPEFGDSQSESAHTIISILEMAAGDFTKTYTEIEAEEKVAANDYAKLSQENRVSKAAKQAEAKAKQSEVTSLTAAIENGSADADGVQKELDAILEYLDKLKPQCVAKAMSYQEKKQRREAEIAGLKEALAILSGDALA